MKVLKSLSYSFFLILISFAACTSDVETLDADLLYGHWNLKTAQRNGEPTETLAGTSFEFAKNGKITTNFNVDGNESTGDFEIQGMTIIQKSNPEVSYSVQILEENKLVLLTKLANFDFMLNLEKSK